MLMKHSITKHKTPGTFISVLSVLYLMSFISFSLMSKFASLSAQNEQLLNTISAMIQVPMLMVMLVPLAKDAMLNTNIKVILGTLLGISALTIAIKGVEEQTLRYIQFIGALPLFVLASILFTGHVKETLYKGGSSGSATILGGIVFASGSFLVLLVLNRIDPQRHASDFNALLGLITVLSSAMVTAGLMMSFEWVKAPENRSYAHPSKAGMAQWENFTLANTPDLMKNSVTDISKYYSEL